MTTETIAQDYMTQADQEPTQKPSEGVITIKSATDSRGRNVYRFEDLARNNEQVVVVILAESEYELRRTKAGRLVLNK